MEEYAMNEIQPGAKLRGGRMITRVSSSSVFLLPVAAFVVAFLFLAMPAHAQNVQVDLSGDTTGNLCNGQECFNAPGIYADGVEFFGSSFMDGGTECTPVAPYTTCPAAYPANGTTGLGLSLDPTPPPSLTIDNIPYTFGVVNSANCAGSGEPACILDMVNLTPSGTTITLPSVQQAIYSTMVMLGTAVNGHHAGTVTVTYTDNTTNVFSQTFSDWCGFGGNQYELEAIVGINRIVANGTTIGPSCNVYSYTYPLDFTRTLQSITLKDVDPSPGSLFALAITLKPPTYTINGGAASPASISAGSTSTATVTVSPQPGYVGTIQLSCSISPLIVTSSSATAPTCSLNPTSVTVTSGEPAPPTTTLTFTSAAPAGSGGAMMQRSSKMFYAFWLPGLGLVGISLRSRGARRRRLAGWMLLGLLLAVLLTLPACVSMTHLGNVGTPPGQYTITVTGLDENNLSQASNPAGTTNTVTLTVTDSN
jgi:hypothetical protein